MHESAELTSVLVVGSGTGEAGPHGWTAETCRILSSEGMRVVLTEPNPAALAVGSGVVESVYAEPITLQHLQRINAQEKPDAVLPTLGSHNAARIVAEFFPEQRIGAVELRRTLERDWRYELEVVRDHNGRTAFAGTVEHIREENRGLDVYAAPAPSLGEREHETLRTRACELLDESDAPAGAYSVRFGRDLTVHDATPLRTWSAALACTASGFPLVGVATRAAIGHPVPEADDSESFDHIVVRAETHSLSATAVAIGRSYPETLRKAIRSLGAATKNEDTLSVTNQPARPNISVADRVEIDDLRLAKASGLSDEEIGRARGLRAETVRELRHALGIRAAFPALATTGPTVVHYSCYDEKAEPAPRDAPAVLLIGDACARTVSAVRAEGLHAVVVTSSPYLLDGGGADRMYLSPLTVEDVLEIVNAEAAAGPLAGTLVLDGHPALLDALHEAEIKVLGWPDARALVTTGKPGCAREIDVEALYDGTELHVCALSEHIDRVRTVPPISLGHHDVELLKAHTETIARQLGGRGALGVTFALSGEVPHVLDIRASRTCTFAEVATGVPLAHAAIRVALGTSIAELRENGVLRPEGDRSDQVAVLRSGVMSVDAHFGSAFAKVMAAADTALPTGGRVFVSVTNGDRRELPLPLRALTDLGFETLATAETAELLRRHGIHAGVASDAGDLIHNGEVHLVVTDEAEPARSRIAVEAAAHGIPHVTTTDGLVAAVQGIQCLAARTGADTRPIQEFHRERGASR